MGDKGYSYTSVRKYLHTRGIRITIPRGKDQRLNLCFDPVIYKERNKVERLVNRFKGFRRIATRYDKWTVSYLCWLTMAAILLWL